MTTNTLTDITSNIKNKIDSKANDSDVLKLIAQVLTPEQKNQLLSNLDGTFLPLNLSKPLIGNYVYRSTNNDYLALCGGTNTKNDSYISLVGCQCSDSPNTISMIPGGWSKGGGLILNSNGDIVWRDKPIQFVESRGKNYIRYNCGMQICWGLEHYPNVSTAVINFPTPFLDYSCTIVDSGNGAYSTDWSTTNIKVKTSYYSLDYFSWVACGWWK